MNINGYIYLFEVDLLNDEEILKRIALCSTIEEAVKEGNKYSSQLKDDEYLFVVPIEVLEGNYGEPPILDCSTSIEGFEMPEKDESIEQYEEMIREELEMETPSSTPDKDYPRKKRIVYKKGVKTTPLSNYVFNDRYDFVEMMEKKDLPDDCSEYDIIPEKDYNQIICNVCWKRITECDCSEWSYDYFRIDPMILPAILTLNKKGYYTRFSCEGHDWTSSEAYISFEAYYDFNRIMPYGWIQRGNKIYCDYKLNLTGKETFEQVKERMINNLIDWSEELDELEGAFTD